MGNNFRDNLKVEDPNKILRNSKKELKTDFADYVVEANKNKKQEQHYTSDPLRTKTPTPKKGIKRGIIKGAITGLAILSTAVGLGIAGVQAGNIIREGNQQKENEKIEQTAEQNRANYHDTIDIIDVAIKQKGNYYDRLLNSDAVNSISEVEALQNVQELRELYFSVVKTKIAHTYGLSTKEIGDIKYKVWEPEELGKEQIDLYIPGREGLTNEEIPLSLRKVIYNNTKIDSKLYEGKDSASTMRKMGEYIRQLNEFYGKDFELDKNGNIIEVENEKER